MKTFTIFAFDMTKLCIDKIQEAGFCDGKEYKGCVFNAAKKIYGLGDVDVTIRNIDGYTYLYIGTSVDNP